MAACAVVLGLSGIGLRSGQIGNIQLQALRTMALYHERA